MKFISLGIIDIKFLIPIFGGIISLIYNFCIKYSPKIGIIGENTFLESIYTSLGMILAFIPYLIIKKKVKQKIKYVMNY